MKDVRTYRPTVCETLRKFVQLDVFSGETMVDSYFGSTREEILVLATQQFPPSKYTYRWREPLDEGIVAACDIVLVIPEDPRLHGYHVRGERWAQDPSFDGQETPEGYWRIVDPIAPGETLLVRPGEWEYDF